MIFYRQYLGCCSSSYAINKDIGFRFLLCVIDIYSKYTWVITLKDKKGIAITNSFKEKLGWKLNRIWVDKGREF